MMESVQYIWDFFLKNKFLCKKQKKTVNFELQMFEEFSNWATDLAFNGECIRAMVENVLDLT